MVDAGSSLPVGTLVAGKLRVVRQLGVGGMGTVYEVEHELTRHRRALKLLHAELACDAHVVTRFLREASAAGRIGSEHIVETFDAGRLDSGEPYLVMELLHGQSLADILAKTGRVSEREAIDWLVQACDGVQAAHDAGIVHRDIKPDNLFIQNNGQLKILDFGISKFDVQVTGELQLTRDNSTLGTPYYMAPEQTTGSGEVDRRADVYALGVVLYEAVTGQRPFEAATFPQLVVRIHLGDYVPASSLSASSALLDRIIAKAMARKPEERFQSARALAAVLRDFARATERGAPFAATQPAPELVPVCAPELAPAAREPERRLPALPAQGPTLISAGNDEPVGAVGAPPPRRRWLLALVIAALAFGVALWRTVASAGRSGPAIAASAAARAPNSTSSSEKNEPLPSVASASPAVPQVVVQAASSAATGGGLVAPGTKSLKPVKRAAEHDLEEKNPF